MARKRGVKYLSTIYSGYKTREQLDQYLAMHSISFADVEANGSDFIVYYEDSKGDVYKPFAKIESLQNRHPPVDERS